jgi:hypothetical protein
MATELVSLAGHRHRPQPAMVSNMTQLEARVRAAIASDRLVRKSAKIAVSADEIGSVTLRGTASSPLQSRAAAHAARSVDGVLNVINEIEVNPLRQARTGQDVARERGTTVKPRAPARPATPGDPDDELQQLARASRALKRREKQAETSISEELRREHWGHEPEHPPFWEKDDSSAV